MNNQKNSNSILPLVIIGGVLLAALALGWWFYNQSNTPAKRTANANSAIVNRGGNTPTAANMQGAQPPNYKGSSTASVVVEEFADYQCPACAGVHSLMNEMTSTYGSRIKFIFRNYPLPAHDKAFEAATAAEAAGLQGKFWDMQNLLFTNQQAWSANSDYRRIFEGYAEQIGLDVERFKNDMAGMNAKARVQADMQRGRAMNVSSTPSIYINGVPIPYDQMRSDSLRQIIDAELQRAPASNPPAASGANPASTANTNK